MITLSIKEQQKTETISLHLKVTAETKHKYTLAAKKLGYTHPGVLLDEITPQLYEQAFKEKQ